ncbi:MAG: GNAT family N-acetyltransferase [Psychroserpens sp.]|uniref:GNAT family N-acetyltransferase n=1 Tax=Psychroserpens sp. TaxID=2020870 RepID=UPI003002FA9C
MKITTLEHVKLNELLDTFNLSFSDYFVTIKLNFEQLKHKMISEDIDLSISVGAFNGGKLVGFILHGKRELDGIKTFYNAGTGVIPKARGQKLTKRMYVFCLPLLQNKKFQQGILEVISNNQTAIPIYKSIGFEITRHLPCYKGIPQTNQINQQLSFKKIDTINWNLIKSFWDWKPTWQNQPETINILSNTLEITVAYLNNVLVAYIIYNHESNRINQFAVHKLYRNQDIGSTLFNHVSKGKSVSLINVDGDDLQTNSFLKHLRLETFLTQFEMKIAL